MTLHFSIEYRTEWGQNVEVELRFLSHEGKAHCERIPLETDDGIVWKGVRTLRARTRQCRYTYIITREAAVERREWSVAARTFPADDARTYFFIDHWSDRPASSHCYSKAFRTAFGIDRGQLNLPALFPRTYLFRIRAPWLREGERVALLGEGPSLGSWDPARALPLAPSGPHEWLLSISADGLPQAFQYKYVVLREDRSVTWEEGDNRVSPPIVPDQNSVVVLSDGEIRLDAPRWQAAGVVVPLFSLRSEGSQGVGDMGDLKEMVEWAARAGMHAVQLLPIHDTTQWRTPQDSYPYSAISVHALHPIYADLRQLPLRDGEAENVLWQELNAKPALDYVEVIKMKERHLRLYYDEQRRTICRRADYQDFLAENADWLLPYQVFCHLRDTFGTPHFSGWSELSVYSQEAATRYAARHCREVGYYAFVQYLLHRQLADASDHARRLRVFLKGDLPIGISPVSVEAWQEPHLFHMDSSAGAPPDDFSHTGQNWGFPTYNWERMAADGYSWWRRRLSHMSRYFSAYRIDHILGFFRIWQIPRTCSTALDGQFSPCLPLTVEEIESWGMRFHEELFLRAQGDGNAYSPRIDVIGSEAWRSLPKPEQDAFIRLYDDFFYRRHNDFWAVGAMQKLPALVDATDMLVCGEDLGMVPLCVGPVMKQLGILSLEIQTMPKAYGVPFANLADNPYQSVATIFTHDMPTLRLWWKETPERAQLYYKTVLGHDGKASRELTPKLAEEVVARHLDCPSMLCLISLQDWLAIDAKLRNPHAEEERINVPANPRHYWRYRMHLTISRLAEEEGFTDRIRSLTQRQTMS